MGGLKVGVFPQTHLSIILATHRNGTLKHRECLHQDRFLDEKLDSRKRSAIFSDHLSLHASALGWKNEAGEEKSTQRASLRSILSHSTTPGPSAGGTV